MKNKSLALAASVLSSVFLFNIQAGAQTNSPPPASASRPAKTPEQTSVPSNSPPATTTQTTGEANPDRTVKKMMKTKRRRSKPKENEDATRASFATMAQESRYWSCWSLDSFARPLPLVSVQ